MIGGVVIRLREVWLVFCLVFPSEISYDVFYTDIIDFCIICIIMNNTKINVRTDWPIVGGDYVILKLDMSGDIPIYVQLRNQIVMGIGRGKLEIGERLPTVRQLALDAGVNTMTVNKAYQVLKAEGFIEIDRRHGAVVRPALDADGVFRERLEAELELLTAEAKLKGLDKQEFVSLCEKIFSELHLQEREMVSEG